MLIRCRLTLQPVSIVFSEMFHVFFLFFVLKNGFKKVEEKVKPFSWKPKKPSNRTAFYVLEQGRCSLTPTRQLTG